MASVKLVPATDVHVFSNNARMLDWGSLKATNAFCSCNCVLQYIVIIVVILVMYYIECSIVAL